MGSLVSIGNPWISKFRRLFQPWNFPVPVPFYVRGDSDLILRSIILHYKILTGGRVVWRRRAATGRVQGVAKVIRGFIRGIFGFVFAGSSITLSLTLCDTTQQLV